MAADHTDRRASRHTRARGASARERRSTRAPVPKLGRALAATLAAAGAACSGPQSALDPAGRDAERIAGIFTWMTVGTVAIWIGVLVLALYAARTRRSPSEEAATRLIVGAGVAFPLAVLTLLLVFGLAELPAIQAPSRDTRLGIEISGSQWWWRVRYMQPGREPIELANELRLPAGRRVNVTVASRDVVHSFWVPALAGKMDMIPGRVNRLALEPTRVGTYRGTCAEFCGMSHARMSFAVVVTGEEEFGDWLSRQAEPAGDPQDPLARQGLATFMARGCQTCHTIRGTPAAGRVGPDLTHVGSRATIAAGTLAMSLENLARWIAEANVIKPGAHMPAFINLPQDERAALAAYLAQLQ